MRHPVELRNCHISNPKHGKKLDIVVDLINSYCDGSDGSDGSDYKSPCESGILCVRIWVLEESHVP